MAKRFEMRLDLVVTVEADDRDQAKRAAIAKAQAIGRELPSNVARIAAINGDSLCEAAQ